MSLYNKNKEWPKYCEETIVERAEIKLCCYPQGNQNISLEMTPMLSPGTEQNESLYDMKTK